VGTTRVIPICTETAAATLSLASSSWRHPRLAGLLWGGEDLAADLGATAKALAADRAAAKIATAALPAPPEIGALTGRLAGAAVLALAVATIWLPWLAPGLHAAPPMMMN